MAIKMSPTRQRWFDVLARWEASGLDAAAFAASEGEPVTPRRLMRWQWKAKRLGAEASGARPAFICLERAPRREPVIVADLEVVSKTGHVVRVPIGFDAATLTRLLAVVDGGGR